MLYYDMRETQIFFHKRGDMNNDHNIIFCDRVMVAFSRYETMLTQEIEHFWNGFESKQCSNIKHHAPRVNNLAI